MHASPARTISQPYRYPFSTVNTHASRPAKVMLSARRLFFSAYFSTIVVRVVFMTDFRRWDVWDRYGWGDRLSTFLQLDGSLFSFSFWAFTLRTTPLNFPLFAFLYNAYLEYLFRFEESGFGISSILQSRRAENIIRKLFPSFTRFMSSKWLFCFIHFEEATRPPHHAAHIVIHYGPAFILICARSLIYLPLFLQHMAHGCLSSCPPWSLLSFTALYRYVWRFHKALHNREFREVSSNVLGDARTGACYKKRWGVIDGQTVLMDMLFRWHFTIFSLYIFSAYFQAFCNLLPFPSWEEQVRHALQQTSRFWCYRRCAIYTILYHSHFVWQSRASPLSRILSFHSIVSRWASSRIGFNSRILSLLRRAPLDFALSRPPIAGRYHITDWYCFRTRADIRLPPHAFLGVFCLFAYSRV